MHVNDDAKFALSIVGKPTPLDCYTKPRCELFKFWVGGEEHGE